jgi:hypothetical protein
MCRMRAAELHLWTPPPFLRIISVYEPMALKIHKANPTPFTLRSGSVSVSTLLGRSAHSPMEAHRELGAVTRSRPSSKHTQLGVVHFYSHVPCPSSHVHTKGIRQLFSHWTLGSALDRPHHFLRLTLFFRSLFMRYTKPYEGFFCWV